LNLRNEPDLLPITASGKTVADISEFESSFFLDLGYKSKKNKIPKSIVFKKYRFSSKAGPNGQAL
jgi:hypothetical protein